MAEPDVMEGRFPREGLDSLGDIDEKLPRIVVIDHAPLHVDFHPTDEVDDGGEGIVVHQEIVVDGETEVIHNSLPEKGDSAVSVGMGGLLPPPSGDLDPGIPRDGHDPDDLPVDVHHDEGDGVSPPPPLDIVYSREKDVDRP